MNTSQPEVNLPAGIEDSTTVTALSTSRNPFKVAPNLSEMTILQGPEPEASTPLNPAILTPPPTVKTPSSSSRHAFCAKEKKTADSFCELLRR